MQSQYISVSHKGRDFQLPLTAVVLRPYKRYLASICFCKGVQASVHAYGLGPPKVARKTTSTLQKRGLFLGRPFFRNYEDT